MYHFSKELRGVGAKNCIFWKRAKLLQSEIDLVLGFLIHGQSLGYSESSLGQRRLAGARFLLWLRRRNIVLKDVSHELVRPFVGSYYRDKRPHQWLESETRAFINHLVSAGHIPNATPPSTSPIDSLIDEYARYIQEECRLRPSTIALYVPGARRMAVELLGPDLGKVGKLSRASVQSYVLGKVKRFGRAVSSKIRPLSNFLLFLYLKGHLKDDLRGAVPRMAKWDLATLPVFLTEKQIRQVIDTCDLDTKVGRRDHAILSLLADLGLRANEVRTLKLTDIDWDSMTIRVVRKGGNPDLLPLPSRAAKALALHLRSRDSNPSTPEVFCARNAPARRFAVAGCISMIVRRALEKTGICTTRKGAHIFRHSLATSMCQRGASLSAIGNILRHASADTTRIYAKVDVPRLRSIARPWIGGLKILDEIT